MAVTAVNFVGEAFASWAETGLPRATGIAHFAAMLTTLVMTVIGSDRPGLVQLVAASVADHGGNWLESRMCHLGGQFAGILRVEIPAEKADGLVRALQALDKSGLRVILHTESGAPVGVAAIAGSGVTLELIGQDRPGILRAVTAVLAANQLNVEDLASERVSAPMGGGTLFQATIHVSVPAAANLAAVRSDLEKIATDLMVDIRFNSAGA